MATVGARVGLNHRVELGLALGARTEESVQRTWERLGPYAARQYSDEYEEHRWARTFFGTLFIARWLVSGLTADEDEHQWMVRGGRLAVAEGVPIDRTTRGYYCWRDAVIDILREEAARLETPADVLEQAIDVTRASCDASLMRMARDQDRHRTEMTQRLAGSEARFRGLYETMACGVMVIDPDGSIVQVNDAAQAIVQHSAADQLLSTNLFRPRSDVRDESGNDLPTLFRALVERHEPVRGRVFMLPAVDSRPARWIQADMVPLLDPDGRLAQVVVTFIDVRPIKEAERARAESQAKTRFLATMSHELRTPLNSVLGFAQLLRMRVGERLDERELRYLDLIEMSGRHLLTIINDVLDLSKIAAGRLNVHVERIDVRPVLEAAARDLHASAQAKGLRLEVAGGPALWAVGDLVRTRQVMLNLVSNAIKFTPAGQVAIEAGNSGGLVEIVVADTGIGIPADQLEVVFDEFTQVEVGSTRSHEGTGLGLPLARHLVELMGGTLTIESELGRGTTARVRLPAAR